MRVLIAGCGYVGLPLGAELVGQGHEVWGLRRSSGAEGELKSAGIQPMIGDITRPETLAGLPAEYDWVVHCVSSSGGGIEEYRQVYLEGTRHLLGWLAAPSKFIYTSSTSVYGQTDGSLVDESSPTEPEAPTSRILVQAEQLVLAAGRERGFTGVVLRLAGIYGPGRGYWFKQFLKGEAKLEGRGERILNMIHRDDVAGALLAALQRGQPGEIYNAVDDEPVSQLTFFRWLSEKTGRPVPPFAAADPDALRKRGVTNKRVSNQKLRLKLGYKFKYPSFREGALTCGI